MGMAVTLAQYLLDRGVAYELVPHPHREALAADRLPADSLVEAVVLRGGDGFMLALLPASRHIQFDALRRLLGRDVDIAGEEQVETLFLDCEPGSVPALGAAYGLDIVVDDSLAQQPDLYLAGGDHAHLIRISGSSFQELTKDARHGQFTGRS
jgi:Ala-tRNA(Pro) deacylase